VILEGEPVSTAVRVQLGVVQRVMGGLTACLLAGLDVPVSEWDASVALLHRPCLGLGAGECDAGCVLPTTPLPGLLSPKAHDEPCQDPPPLLAPSTAHHVYKPVPHPMTSHAKIPPLLAPFTAHHVYKPAPHPKT
jgi:hypothetical protein